MTASSRLGLAPLGLLLASVLFSAACGEERGQALPGSQTGQAATAPVAEGLPTPAAGDAIAQGIFDRAGQFAEGMEPATILFRGTLETGATQDYQAVLQPGQCFKVLGVGGEGVNDLDLLLFDQNGVQVRQDVARDNYPVLGLSEPVCPEVPGAYRVQVRMYRGAGEFGVQVFQTPRR